MAYTALARASVTIELFENEDKYEAVVVSTNGIILQPYDTSTTLIGSVLKNNIDITKNIKNVRWTKWNPTSDNLEECEDWNKTHIGSPSIIITKEDVDSKSVFTFEAYNNKNELLCSSSISIVDINDLLASTSKPLNPYIGQLWVDDSTDPAKLYVWNGYKWIISGAVGVVVKNLLYNTGFLYNSDKWDIVGDTTLSYTPTPHTYLEHRFIKLNSDVLTDTTRGISQTTIDYIAPNSEYSFHMIFYSKEFSQSYSNDITVKIYSIDSSKNELELYSNTVTADTNLKKIFAKFKSLNNTKHIKVQITGQDNARFDFNIAEPCLYNTYNEYPWTTNPADENIKLTQENLWNILSNDNTVKGITSIKNPITGQLDYYINADAINAGQVKAQYMNMYGLTVTRRDDPAIKTLEITEDGNVNMTVNELKIGSSNQTLEEYVNTNIVVNGDSITAAVRDEFNNKITEINTTIDGVNTRVENLEEDSKTLFNITDKGVYIETSADGSSTLVDINNNSFSISTENIRLEGYTTINGGFSVDLEGNMSANNATISGTLTAGSNIIGSNIIGTNISNDDGSFNIDSDGNIYGGSININDNFVVDSYGRMTSNEAIISGTVTAGSNIIGANIANINSSFRIDPDGNIYGGSININNNFVVDSYGKMTSTSANITGNINSGSVINGATIYVPGKNEGYSEFIYDITLEDGTLKMTNRLTPETNYLNLQSSALYNKSVQEVYSSSNIYSKNILSSMYLGDASLIFEKKEYNKFFGNPTDKYDSYTFSMWDTNHFEINDGWIRANDLICINSIKKQTNVDYNSDNDGEIIYNANDNTFNASHYIKEGNTIGDFSGAGIDSGNGVLTLGDAVLLYGSYVFTNLGTTDVGVTTINFDDIYEYAYGSKRLQCAPYISLTVQSNDPANNFCTFDNVASDGFDIYCTSSTGSVVTVCWMAIGACKANPVSYMLFEDFISLNDFILSDGIYDSDNNIIYY